MAEQLIDATCLAATGACIPCAAGEHANCWDDAVYDRCLCAMRQHYPAFCRRCGHSREAHAYGLDYRACNANDCDCPQMGR